MSSTWRYLTLDPCLSHTDPMPAAVSANVSKYVNTLFICQHFIDKRGLHVPDKGTHFTLYTNSDAVRLGHQIRFLAETIFSSTSRTHRFQLPPRILLTRLHLMAGLRMSDRCITQRHHALDTTTSALLPRNTERT